MPCHTDRLYMNLVLWNNLASEETRKPTGDDVDEEHATFQYLSYSGNVMAPPAWHFYHIA